MSSRIFYSSVILLVSKIKQEQFLFVDCIRVNVIADEVPLSNEVTHTAESTFHNADNERRCYLLWKLI